MPKNAQQAVPPIATLAERFLAAIRDDRVVAANRLLARRPELAGASIHTAAATADLAALTRWLAADRALLGAVHGPEDWPPLAYACRSRLHRTRPGHAAQRYAVVACLLDAGASANSHSWWDEGARRVPISVLYHAVMGDHVDLVRLLLERGARTDDGESVYHAAQYNRRACLAELLAHGADLSSRQSPYGNTPLYFLAGHESDQRGTAAWYRGLCWLLQHGADPNVTSYHHRETPLHAVARSPLRLAAARQLLAHGADPRQPRADGRTPYVLALRHGNTALLELLAERGVTEEAVGPEDAFLGACLTADVERARHLLAAHPELSANLARATQEALTDAIRADNAAALRLLVDLGCQLSWQGTHGGTPLHWAAWLGKPALVELLIALGAPLDQRDAQFGSSPLGWAAHGSSQHHDDDAYCAIIDRLVDAGATLEPAFNRWGAEPAELATPRVKRRLAERGMVKRT